MILSYTRKIFFLGLITSFFFISTLKGQADNPTFEVDVTRGCVGLEVKVISKVDTLPTVYDYGVGQGTTDETSFIYKDPGRYYITQYIVGSDGEGKESSYKPLIEIYAPDKPKVDIELCAGRKVLVSIRKGEYTNYIVDYGDGKFDTMSVGQHAQVYTYKDTSAKILNFSGYVKGMRTGCGTNPYTIKPVDTLAVPKLSKIEVLQDGGIQMDLKTYSTGIYKLYENISSGKNNEYELAYNQSVLLLKNVDTESETYNYQLEAQDRCNSQPARAKTVLATYDVDLATELGKNTLSWKNSTQATADSVMIYRDGLLIGVIRNPSEKTFYEDTKVTCGKRYCYRLEVSLSGGLAKSFSRQECIVTSSDSHPRPLKYAWASIASNSSKIDSLRKEHKVRLIWDIPKDKIIRPMYVQIRKRVGADSMNLPIQKIILPYESHEKSYLDTATNPDKISYGYYISYLDECGNASPETYLSRPIILNYKTKDVTGDGKADDMILRWNRYEGYSDVVYYLEKLDTLGKPYDEEVIEDQDSTFLKLSLLTLDSQSITYRIKAVATKNPALITYSNTITYSQEAKLIYPTAFSPNWDGVNDEFRIYAFFIDKTRPIKVRIMNRWGNPIFAYDSTQEEPFDDQKDPNILNFVWAGTANGQHVPPGVYIIQIEAFDMLGKLMREKKTLTILR